MALNPNRYTTADTVGQEEIDVGLRSYMRRVYNYMALGVAFTGVLVLALSMNPNIMIPLAVGPMKWVLFVGLLGMGWFSPKIISMRSTAAAHAFFWAYCALWGIMISPMVAYFLNSVEGSMDVARAFFITAGTFAGVSIFGYTTKKNLNAFATFMMMAVIGLIVAGLVNAFFVGSTGFSLLISVATVLVFAGITAWETQNIKNMYMDNLGDEQVTRYALFGALQLYGSFIVLFIHILHIIGIMRD